MSFLRFIGRSFVVILVLLMLSALIASWFYRDIPALELEDKYANEHSKFVTIDGARIHYRDEGTGPVLVLIHAQFASLLGWQPWVDGLKDSYRVIRFDLTSHGLTGPDPTGDYSMKRTMYLAEQLFDTLHLDRFSLGGTSVGGTVAMRYSASHPERVEKLILLSPGALEGRAQVKNRSGQLGMLKILEYILPRAIPEALLKMGFGDPDNVPPELVDRWYDLWRLEGQRAAEIARLGQYIPGDIEAVVRAIVAPTLLLWGEQNHQAHVEQAPVFEQLLENAESVKLIIYPGVGHMAVQEAGATMVVDVRTFLESP